MRNEALDRRVYALAALHAGPVPWEGSPARGAPTEPPPRPHHRPTAAAPQQRLFVAAASACEPLRAAAHTIQDEMIYRFG